MPVRVVERRGLGTTREAQTLPIDAGEAATTFWRKDELCVVQAQASGRHVEQCSGKHTVTVVLPRDVPGGRPMSVLT